MAARPEYIDIGKYVAVLADTEKPKTHRFAITLPGPEDAAYEAYGDTGFSSDHFSLPDFATATTYFGQVLHLSTRPADPLIEGTHIPIYRVAALLDGGMTPDEVAEDFPSLTMAQIMDAYDYATRNPPPPNITYPGQSLKRLLRNTGLGDLQRTLKAKKRRRKRV